MMLHCVVLLTYLQSADKEIDALHIRLEAVKQKGQAMAKYFCDNRPKFLDVVFLEMKKFMDEFNRVIQVSVWVL